MIAISTEHKTPVILALFFLFSCLLSVISDAQVISTYAGNGTSGLLNGNINTASANAQFKNPADIAIDANGNKYISDQGNHVIRKIDNTGEVITYAGSGTAGYANEVGTSAQFNSPTGLAIDATNNKLYVADKGNNCIRVIDLSNASVSLVAGSGSSSTTDGTGITNGIGAAARFTGPTGLDIDIANNVLYVADQSGYRIRKIALSNNNVTLVAGSTQWSGGSIDGTLTVASFNKPYDVAYDAPTNTIYVADANNFTIRKIDLTAGQVSTIVGIAGTASTVDGYGIAATTKGPNGLALSNGYLYFTDNGGYRIKKMNLKTSLVTTVVGREYGGLGDGLSGSATVKNATGLFVDASDALWVADWANHAIRKITTSSLATSNITITNATIAPQSMIDLLSQTAPNELVASVGSLGASGGAVGPISARLWIDGAQNPTYVKRHHQITPATDGSGIITLYYTQEEFNEYNSSTTLSKLPINGTDATGISNIRINKYSGSSNNNTTGVPSTYTGTLETIDPDDSKIVWNSFFDRWEITFDVSGFSGFFLTSQAASSLPITFGDISAFVKEGSLFVNWSTLVEKNNDRFEIQLSKDGKHFKTISTLNSKALNGQSDGQIFYSTEIKLSSFTGLLGASAMLILSLFGFGYKQKRVRIVLYVMMISLITLIACNKNQDGLNETANQKLFLKIVQVDKDGTTQQSKVIQVVYE